MEVTPLPPPKGFLSSFLACLLIQHISRLCSSWALVSEHVFTQQRGLIFHGWKMERQTQGGRIEGCCPASGNKFATVVSPFSTFMMLKYSPSSMSPSSVPPTYHSSTSICRLLRQGHLKRRLKTPIKASFIHFYHSYFLLLYSSFTFY